MSHEFLLPDLGEGLTEAEIVSWLVAPGDVIAVDQLVVEVESAKSIVELPSPYGGRVEALHAAVGTVIHAGAPLITVLAADDSDAPVDPPVDAATDAAGSGAVLVGYGTTESTVRLKRPESGRFKNRMEPARISGAAATKQLPGPAATTLRSPVVSPVVRKRAKLHGLDASQLVGSGPGSLVLREDVDAAIASLEARTPSADAPAPVGATAGTSADDVRIPITGMRKLIGARLSNSRRTIPEATIWLDVDATELITAKERLQRTTGERFSLNALIARFVVAGLKQYPVLNSSVDEVADQIVQHHAINLGLAAQTPRGLMVPVVHNAQELTTRQLRDAIASLVSHSERGDYPPAALTGGTFTLNNYGGFGVDGSTPIINHPEVAMLGVGRVIDRPWVVDGQLAVRKVVVLSFVFDHRVCDGDVASGFLTYVARCVEEPLLLLGNL